MKKMLPLFLSILFCSNVFAATNTSPIGYWKTIDDVTGKPKSILHIYQSENQLYGQVVKIFPRPGFDENEVCSKCKGEKRNQRIVGMIVMEGLKQSKKNPAEWSDGQILDPMNGKTYSCNIATVNKGNNLNVRGYIGFSLFGRTQTWLRIENASL